MTSLVLNITAPPSVNRSYANLAGVGRVKTKVRRAWGDTVGWEIKTQTIGHKTFLGDVSVVVLVERKRTDLDNVLKSILDIMTKMKIYQDDKQVVDIHMRFAEVTGVRLTISEVTT